MQWEYSSGAVLYRMQNGEPMYILVYDSHYGFPKGHIEPGEDEQQAALREIREETGLSAALDTRFTERIEYDLPKKPGTRKRVTFFLAACGAKDEPQASNEIRRVRVVPYAEARELLWLDSLKTVLEKADRAIRQQSRRSAPLER